MLFTNKLRIASENIVRCAQDGHYTAFVDLSQTGKESGKLVLEITVAPDTDVDVSVLSAMDQAAYAAGEWWYSRANVALRVAAHDLYIGRRLIALPDHGDELTRVQRWHMLLSAEVMSLAHNLTLLNGVEIALRLKELDLYSDQRAT